MNKQENLKKGYRPLFTRVKKKTFLTMETYFGQKNI